jgi:surfactin synthase thioesterase subunit
MIAANSARNRFLTFSPQPDARLRVFCLPYAGGGASIYRPWVRHLPAEVQVCPIQLPGREERLSETPVTRVPLLVASVAEALTPHLDLPYVLFGHSLGALLAFELARELRRRELPGPKHLFVSAARAPHLSPREHAIHDLPETEFIAELCRRYGSMPTAVLQSAELMALLLPILRADLALLETYQHGVEPPLACPIGALTGTEDPHVRREEVAAWREHTAGGFTLQLLPGGHLYLKDDPTAVPRALARGLTSYLP